jgi:hypothetical protein
LEGTHTQNLLLLAQREAFHRQQSDHRLSRITNTMMFALLSLPFLLSLGVPVHSLRGAERLADHQWRTLNDGGSWLSVLSTSFESGIGSDFEIGVNAIEHEMGSDAQHGTKVIKLDNSGSESVMTSKSIDVKDFDRVEVSFYYRGESLEGKQEKKITNQVIICSWYECSGPSHCMPFSDGDSFVVEFQNDGVGPWRIAKNFIQNTASGIDMNNGWAHQRLQWLTHDGIQNTNSIRIRFHSRGNTADDTIFIDSFNLLGRSCEAPSASPSLFPSAAPNESPSKAPSETPSAGPSAKPSPLPSESPNASPSAYPSNAPTLSPSSSPVVVPSSSPSNKPTDTPSASPSNSPTSRPSGTPTVLPSNKPSKSSTGKPSEYPSVNPSGFPSTLPSLTPTSQPTSKPTEKPPPPETVAPTPSPTNQKSQSPVQTPRPTSNPSETPTEPPTANPSKSPTARPTNKPTALPTGMKCFAVPQGKRGKVKVRWAGFRSKWVDVFRDGKKSTTIKNQKGVWNDNAASKGSTHAYQVCEPNTQDCCGMVSIPV